MVINHLLNGMILQVGDEIYENPGEVRGWIISKAIYPVIQFVTPKWRSRRLNPWNGHLYKTPKKVTRNCQDKDIYQSTSFMERKPPPKKAGFVQGKTIQKKIGNFTKDIQRLCFK